MIALKSDTLKNGWKLQDKNMVENVKLENGCSGKWQSWKMKEWKMWTGKLAEYYRTGKWRKMWHRKMIALENDSPGKRLPWKMTALGKGQKIIGLKNGRKHTTGKWLPWIMTALENEGSENDRPGKWWKITGPENGRNCEIGKWLSWKN